MVRVAGVAGRRGADLGHLAHLARRFVTSLRPGGPHPADDAWAISALGDGEQRLWRRMSPADRRHAVGVARAVVHHLGPNGAPRPVIAAALLHDVGKVEAGLGTFARAAVTAAALLTGRDRIVARTRDGRVGRYLEHDVIGAELLAAAGADRLTIAWAREHHLPREAWTVPRELADALKSADDG